MQTQASETEHVSNCAECKKAQNEMEFGILWGQFHVMILENHSRHMSIRYPIVEIMLDE